jgi:hypothetical protein
MALKLIQKTKSLKSLKAKATLEANVTKTGGPLNSRLEVASKKHGVSFSDSQLTPGPATTTLDPAHSYTLVWLVAFASQGTATLRVRIVRANGNVVGTVIKKVTGKAGDEVARVILIPGGGK